MKWFPGSINDAVTASKQREAIFVVFVEGKDETSIEAARVLNGDDISSRLDRDDIVAIRIDSDAESYNFFKQIYQVVPVPSLFFIGTNGVPLKVIDRDFSPALLSTRLDEILAKVEKKDSSSSLIRAEQDVATTTTTSLSEPVAGNSKLEKPDSSVEKLASTSNEDKTREITTEERLERAKQLIELQRRQKIEKDREDERKREIERRQLGKDVQMAKQKQHELEVKLALDERAREKAAEAAAKERVRRQIAQDKLERKQRELDLQQQQVAQQQQPITEQQSSPSTSNDSAIARIQFRLPSGGPHMGKFDADSTLGSLRSYVAGNIELPFQKFAMSTTFPRRDLTIDDDDKTLTELELVPTAVILILPVKNSKVTSVVTSSDDVGFVSRFVWALFAPVVTIYNYVIGYFAGSPPADQPETRRNEATGVRTSENPERFGRVLGQSSGSMSRDLLGGPSTTIRSRGNIHRLHSGGDDNDENNTWNGNSTQQM